MTTPIRQTRAQRWDAGLDKLETRRREALATGRPITFSAGEIAEEVGVTRQAVEALVKNALLKLRRPAKQLHEELFQ
jgi:DNA-directed RNA polymerase specialized sigma24 family protein